MRKFNKSEKFIHIKYYLKNKFNDIPENEFSYKEVLFRIKHNIKTRPVCLVCGKPVHFNKKKSSYSKTCCNKVCLQKIIEETSLLKFGFTNASKSEEVKEHVQRTLLSKYNADNARKIPEVNNKIKETNKNKYGCEYGLSSAQVINKRKNTVKSKYGQDITNVFQLDSVKEKIKQTLKIKYGNNIENISQVSEIKDRLKNKRKETVQKIFNTKKKNNTLNKSAEEDELFLFLQNNFKNVVRHKKTNVYPFDCDFYISEFDLYIEYNGHWTHGHVPYMLKSIFTDKIEHQLKLFENKAQDSDYFKNAVETWTVRDINKFKTAITNNLNYLVIYKLDKDLILSQVKGFSNSYHKQIFIY